MSEGWICPKCKQGVNPNRDTCPCTPKQQLPTGMFPEGAWYCQICKQMVKTDVVHQHIADRTRTYTPSNGMYQCSTCFNWLVRGSLHICSPVVKTTTYLYPSNPVDG